MKTANGRLVVAGLLAVGALLAGGAVLFWKRPATAARGNFALFHSLVVRGKPDSARGLLADPVIYDGTPMSPAAFMEAYVLPAGNVPLEVVPCASAPEHWDVHAGGRVTCMVNAGGTWKLHRTGPEPCACAQGK